MAKTYKKKKTTYTKKSYRKSYRKKKFARKGKYDGVVKRICIKTLDVLNDSAVDAGVFRVYWGHGATAGANA